LEEAVAAYREALKERTREHVPLQWAETQSNLGGVLKTLGERKSDVSLVCEGLDAHVAAWEVFSSGALHRVSVALGNIKRDIALLTRAFDPASYLQSLAKHAEALKRMGISCPG